jgi:MFS family permease
MTVSPTPLLPLAAAVRVFLVFALAYFFSALLRAVTATLAPVFGDELGLRASDLGLLAGAYFLGFAAMQLPVGATLDRYGPKRVLLALLALAVVGCAAFAMATSLASLIVARALIGIGVAACLMAPLTCFRARFDPAAQLRANSWMLMTGSLGMVASTLPVQWLLPYWGWRGLFWGVAGLLLVCIAALAAVVPVDPHREPTVSGGAVGYVAVWRHPVFVRSAPMGFFIYGGLIAVQALWAGPWLTQVAGWSSAQAAAGLFAINLSMLVSFMAWGAAMPRLTVRGVSTDSLMRWGLPMPILFLGAIVLWPQPAGAAAWALWCVSCTFVSLSLPAIGLAFDARIAGRALSAYNLVIFAGVFCLQWGIGLAIDLFRAAGLSEASAFRASMAVFCACSLVSYLWYLRAPRDGANRLVGQ